LLICIYYDGIVDGMLSFIDQSAKQSTHLMLNQSTYM
jgi:hypothetical protein